MLKKKSVETKKLFFKTFRVYTRSYNGAISKSL